MPPALKPFPSRLLLLMPFACTPTHYACTPVAYTTRFPISRPHRGQINRVTRETERTVNLRQSAAKLDVLSRSSSPLAGQIWRSPPLVMRGHVVIDRGRRLTDEAFRTRIGKLSAGSSGCLFHVFAPVWHSGALLRASNRRGRASRVDSWTGTLIGLGPQSK